MVPIFRPKYEPSHQHKEDDLDPQDQEAEPNRIVVAELRVELVHNVIRATLRDLLENDLASVVHRRYPAQELDEEVCIITCIRKTSSTKVHKSDNEITEQDCNHLIIGHRTNHQAEEGSGVADRSQRGHIRQHVSEAVGLQTKAVERADRDDYRIEPDSGDSLSDFGPEVGMDRVHVI